MGMVLAVVFASHLPAQWQCARLHSFGETNLVGEAPSGGLLPAGDGRLYGTTSSGGLANAGVLYSLRPDGSDFVVHRQFGIQPGDGKYPAGELLEASDGHLYGVTLQGGAGGAGTIFSLDKGGGYQVIKAFDPDLDGVRPLAGLVEAANGFLYGTLSNGKLWPTYKGAVFRLQPSGGDFSVLHFFPAGTNDGALLESGLLVFSNSVYGVTSNGGEQGAGTVFRLGLDGEGYQVLRHFRTDDSLGRVPRCRLLPDRVGRLYGCTLNGGSGLQGVIFRLNPDGTGYEVLHHFASLGKEGANPGPNLTWGPDGALYGVTSEGGLYGKGVLFKVAPASTNYVVVRHFQRALTDGGTPSGPLVFLADGALLGVAKTGGERGGGVVYQLDPGLTNFLARHSFPLASSRGGYYYPYQTRLTLAADGWLYGAIPGGYWGQGLIYKVKRDGGGMVILRHLGTAGDDGSSLLGGLLVASNGRLYGTTENGGSAGNGTLFSLNRDGSGFTNLQVFANTYLLGFRPATPLIEGRDGMVYGATSWGGTNGNGTLFRLNQDGTGYQTIRHFQGGMGSEGGRPKYLLEGQDGYLYGCNTWPSSCLFKVRKDGGDSTLLRRFDPAASGQVGVIQGPVWQAADGFLYGTTLFSNEPQGTEGGAMFRISTNGTGFTVLRRWLNPAAGYTNVQVGLSLGAGNVFYGTCLGLAHAPGGLFFRVNPDGSGYAELYRFPATGIGARSPFAVPVPSADGFWYGCALGGDVGMGTVYRLGQQFLTPPTLRGIGCRQGSFEFCFKTESNILYQAECQRGLSSGWQPFQRVWGTGQEVWLTAPDAGEGFQAFRLMVP